MSPTETKLREALRRTTAMVEHMSCGECGCLLGPRPDAFACCALAPVTLKEEHGCDDCSDVRQTLEDVRAALALPPSPDRDAEWRAAVRSTEECADIDCDGGRGESFLGPCPVCDALRALMAGAAKEEG